MRDPEQIAADLKSVAHVLRSNNCMWDADRVDEAAEALREQEAAIESTEAENVMAQAERDALIAYVRAVHDENIDTRPYYANLPESVRQKIEASDA